MSTVKVYIELCRDGIVLPEYARLGDAGMDVRAAVDTVIMPGETKAVPTGLKLAIPQGYEVQVRPRSGLSLKTPLRISNSPGTIDSGYRDEVCIIISNMFCPCCSDINVYSLDELKDNKGAVLIKREDRIAQLVLKEIPVMQFIVTDNISDIGNNRGGGFGSTGI